jgi:hypothetical protein
MLAIETYREILTRQGFTPHGEAFGADAHEFSMRHPEASQLTLEARLPQANIIGVEETNCLLFSRLAGRPLSYPWEAREPLDIILNLDGINAPALAERLIFATVLSFTELPAPERAKHEFLWED